MTAQGPDELRAVHAARRELGPDYDDALLTSFVDRAEAQLQRRLEDARPTPHRVPPSDRGRVQVTLGPSGLALVLVNSAWGVVSSLVLSEAYHEQLARLIAIWVVVAIADAAYLGARVAGGAATGRKHDRPAPLDRPSRPATPRQTPGSSPSS